MSESASSLYFDELVIDMQGVYWFDANMAAPFGALLYRIGRNINTITIENIQPGVRTILQKNGFLSTYGQEKIVDNNETTIEYQRFDAKDDRYFASYIEKYFVGKGLPRMSVGLHKKFRESIFEIFSNSVIHSGTRLGIYSCGQFFPTKNLLIFSVVDLGVGIRQNIKDKLNLELSAEQAIRWATSHHNTTKTGPVPGGLGLKLLREFITQNNGRIQIISENGYWELLNGQISTRKFDHPFPGTVVNIQINTSDTSSYCLSSEIDADSIF